MEVSLLVAKILGVYMVVSGLFLLFRGKTVPHMLKDFFGHPAIVYLTGVILIFLSTLLLLESSVWDGTWRSVITVFAWLVMLKGLGYLFVPEMLHKMVNKKLMANVSIYGLIAILAGFCLFFVVQ